MIVHSLQEKAKNKKTAWQEQGITFGKDETHCPECPKHFTKPSALQRHWDKFHEGIKPTENR